MENLKNKIMARLKDIRIAERTSDIAQEISEDVMEVQVALIELDDDGMVKELRRYTLEDGQVIDPVTRKTPAPGRELTFIEQLVGNFGRFNERRDK